MADEVKQVVQGEGYAVGSLDGMGDGPGFRKIRRELDVKAFGVNAVVMPAGIESGRHYHDEQEELYVVTRGTLTMRFGDEIRKVGAGSVARVAARTPRSHRNEGDEPVEMWAVSRRLDHQDAVKLDDFWEASPDAAQERPADS